MDRIIIRDDDVNYFTHPEDIEKAYGRIPFFPVSFAIVPNVINVGGDCPETKGNTSPRFIGENKLLVDYLNKRFNAGTCDILMHGLSHEYHYTKNGEKISEMIWLEKESPETLSTISDVKKQLEQELDLPITCFVAPHNDIGKKGIRAVYKSGMNFSGIIPINFQRDFTYRSINNYIKRMICRILKGIPYPGVLDYGTHLEINAYNSTNKEKLLKVYRFCKDNHLPMAINVHYWHMRDFPEKYNDFFDFIDYAITDGAIPSRMRDII